MWPSRFVCKFLQEIIDSGRFDLEEYRQRKLSISEAFALLWQDPKTGDVRGRSADEALHCTAVACVLLDLYALGKIQFYYPKLKKDGILNRLFSLPPECRQYRVRAIDRFPTCTFLDDCVFNLILDTEKHHNMSFWMESSMTYPSHVLTAILRSLVNKGILDVKHSKTEDTKFPTLNPEPQRKLLDEIKMIALHGHVVDGFMWPLLKLSRGCEHICTSFTTIIIKQFESDETTAALSRIDKVCFPELKQNSSKKSYQKFKVERTGSLDGLFE